MKLCRFMLLPVLAVCLMTGCGKGGAEKGQKPQYNTAETYSLSDNKDVRTLASAIDTLYNSNAYIKIQVGEGNYQYLRVNALGEAYNNSGLIGLPDTKVLSLNMDDNTVYTTNEGLNLQEIQSALKITDEGKGTISCSPMETGDTGEGIYQYTIKIEGKDNIMDYYRKLTNNDNDFANIAYEVLLQNAKDEDSIFLNFLTGIDTKNTENNGFSARMSFGDKDGEYTAWLINGYIPTMDWTLDPQWYEEGLTAEQVKKLFDALDKQTNMDLVLSNNDVFDGYSTNISYEEYQAADNKNEIINAMTKELASLGITYTMDIVTLKRQLDAFYSDEAYSTVPLIKAAAYICALNGQVVETEPTPLPDDTASGGGVELTDELAEQIAQNLEEQAKQ